MSITEQALRASVAGGYRTLKDIGTDFGVTRERIRQLCNYYGILRPRAFDEYAPRTQLSRAPRSRWPRETLTVLKRRLGLCQAHGCYAQPMPNRVRCAEHLQAQAKRASSYFTTRRARGLCFHCDELPAPGHTLCQRHLDLLRISARRHARKAAA